MKRGDVVNYRGVAAEVVDVGPIVEWVEQWDGSEAEVVTLGAEQARVVMVGDDQRFVVDVDEFEVIDEDAYCGGCGQIGCGAYG